MTAKVKVIDATANSDFDAIRQVYYVTWQDAYHGLISDDFLAHLSPASWHPERRWQDTLLAVDDKDKIVGVCSFGPARLPDFNGWGELYSIYVLPQFQHTGVGAVMMTRALQRLHEKFDQFYIRVLDNNVSAQKFYQHFGFSVTDQIMEDTTKFGTIRERVMVKQDP